MATLLILSQTHVVRGLICHGWRAIRHGRPVTRATSRRDPRHRRGIRAGMIPINYVITTELLALRLRDRSNRAGLPVSIFVNSLVNLIMAYLMGAPYANLQGRFGRLHI